MEGMQGRNDFPNVSIVKGLGVVVIVQEFVQAKAELM